MEPLSAFIGAIVAALVTAYATWWVSIRIERQTELRQLRSAIRIVRTELVENAERLKEAGGDVQAARSALLLGDWLGSKVAFAGISPRNEELWRKVARMYGRISDFKYDREDEPPDAAQLDALATALQVAEQEVDADLRRFSRLLSRTG